MKYLQRVERLEEHLKYHPTDYQAVVAHLKARSDMIEHGQYLRMIERRKRLAEVNRQIKEIQNGKKY